MTMSGLSLVAGEIKLRLGGGVSFAERAASLSSPGGEAMVSRWWTSTSQKVSAEMLTGVGAQVKSLTCMKKLIPQHWPMS